MLDLTPAAFAKLFDHTLLKPEATPGQIRALCGEAKALGTAGVCVNPCHVALAAKELQGTALKAMAVIGFPLGANRTDVKIDEALRAVGDGAGELDMVINIGYFLGGEMMAVRHDIAAVVRAAGHVPTKVILETALLSESQIRELTLWCIELGAAFVKTSTGFAARGASVRDIELMAAANHDKPGTIGVKASGGIKTLDAALALINAGATRLGSSATMSLVEEFKTRI